MVQNSFKKEILKAQFTQTHGVIITYQREYKTELQALDLEEMQTAH